MSSLTNALFLCLHIWKMAITCIVCINHQTFIIIGGPSRSYLFLVVFYLNWFISIGKPWTLQYFVQHLLTKLLIYPTLFNGCRCNKETLASIKQAGFKTVQAEKGWLQWSSEAISKPLNPFTFLLVRSAFAIVNSGIAGFAEKWLVVETRAQV